MQLDGVGPPAPRPERLPVQDLGVYERHGGHTLRRHVDTRPGDELRRILSEGVAAAGRFLNRPVAQRCVETIINRRSGDVTAWRDGPESNVPFTCVEDMGQVIGRCLTWDDVSHGLVHPKPVTAVRLVLRRRSELRGGFTVVTAYPTRAPRRRRRR
ncbi:MAG: RNase A-like domain-containing protein [Candidatus Dormibacteria bacterium]